MLSDSSQSLNETQLSFYIISPILLQIYQTQNKAQKRTNQVSEWLVTVNRSSIKFL